MSKELLKSVLWVGKQALVSLCKVLSCQELLVITRNEEVEVESEGKQITILPIWKWLLDCQNEWDGLLVPENLLVDGCGGRDVTYGGGTTPLHLPIFDGHSDGICFFVNEQETVVRFVPGLVPVSGGRGSTIWSVCRLFPAETGGGALFCPYANGRPPDVPSLLPPCCRNR